MSYANINNVKIVDGGLVEKILEQGQKLRNSMVESILKNDPFCSDAIYSKHFNTPRSSYVELTNRKPSESDSKIIDTFLKGEYMSKEEEKVALDTIRTMSVPDLFKTTERSLLTNRSDCKCSTCSEYCEKNLNCDLRRPRNLITQQIKDKYLNENIKLLYFVDSLKISVQSLKLNEAGVYKVFSNIDNKMLSSTRKYFLEYQIPEKIVKKSKNKSKVDTGLDHNFIRICSRQNNEVITFKHIFVHDITPLDEVDLENIIINFKISYRTSKLKKSKLLGHAKFNFDAFKVSKNLICVKELPVFLENDTIVVGYLKVSMQLGCGKLYFGKEFIEAVSSNKRESVVLNSDDDCSEEKVEIKAPPVLEMNKKKVQHNKKDEQKEISSKNQNKVTNDNADISEEKQVLFGFVYVSEAQFNTEAINTYLSLQPFCQNDTCYSCHVPNNSNPEYNFSQLIPLIYDEDLLFNLRENFMLLEFWEKARSDNIFGLAKVPLHQFYLAYRNPVILKYLSKNKFPIASSDGWEPIYSLENEEIIGQVQVLAALGTEEQIKNLQVERGFKNDVVHSKNSKTVHHKPLERLKVHLDRKKLNPPIKKPDVTNAGTNTSSVFVVSPKKSPPKKVDIAVQSEFEMDDSKKISPTQEVLGSFLSQLLAQRQKNIYVENGTNTDSVPQTSRTNLEVRKTSELLDTLQKALAIDGKAPGASRKDTFKALIAINCANQLPIRRRYKSKKTRSRKDQIEEAMPSTYVTFETTPGSNLKLTQVVLKSTTPKYDYNAEVDLPIDLLTNNQKKLVFKVWKKSTNITNTPNLQTDIIVGLATLDLTVLLAGLPNVQGWFNIVDFSGKCNGQINIHVNPLEDLSKFQTKERKNKVPEFTAPDDEPNELLGRALKRKFTELDEITQRLRLRLSEVTREDSDGSNDELEKEFENDINTLCVEEDFNLVNFDDDATGPDCRRDVNDLLSLASGSKTSSDSSFGGLNLNRELLQGKQKIDSLLEKLTLISKDQPFTSRYVSGCSVTNEADPIDTEAILKDLDKNSRPNIQSQDIFESDMFRRAYESEDSGASASCGEFRAAPEGEGNILEEKANRKA